MDKSAHENKTQKATEMTEEEAMDFLCNDVCENIIGFFCNLCKNEVYIEYI